MSSAVSSGFDFDVVVVGGGSAGYAAARTVSAAGLRAAVIEGADEVGGLCILRGCMPTKALLYAADVIHLARHAQTWGIHAEVKFDFKEVMARKAAMIQEFADYRRQQLTQGRFEFIRVNAQFVDAHTLELSNGKRISSAHFILATGSVIAPSPLPQLTDLDCLTSDDLLDLDQPPKSMIVLGGGPVAVELAQFYARFGTKITLIQRGKHILHDADTDAAECVMSVFRREGMTIYTGTKLLDAGRNANGKSVTFEYEGNAVRVEAEEIFYALGRVPNTACLKLPTAGVKTEGTRIVANPRMQTSVPHIYAAGDCTGPYEIVHIAIQQAELAAHNIAHPDSPREIDYRLLVSVIFTDPQVGVVGLTEKTAKARSIPYLAASYPFADHGKSLIMEAKDGFVKLLADPKSGEIIGGSCVGPAGGELIHEIIAAMHKRMSVRELATMPHYHPTLAEIWTYPAEELAEKIGNV